jgi:hypothetical protein
MSPEEAVLSRIVDLNTSAGARIYMLKLPQQVTLPAARVQLVDDPGDYHLRGGSFPQVARVQVDTYAEETSGTDPYAASRQLADEINGDDCGSGISGAVWSEGSPEIRIIGAFRVDRQAFYEPEELRIVRIRQDFLIHYRQN